MRRQLKFSIQAPVEARNTDLVEINLHGDRTQAKQQSAQTLDELLQSDPNTLRPHRGYPYGYGETGDEAGSYFCRKSNTTGQLAVKVSPPPPSASNISCLRQMYCPKCHERLHEQGVRLERLLTLCCFSLLPIYSCCMRRSKNECKVICEKCGYLLGALNR